MNTHTQLRCCGVNWTLRASSTPDAILSQSEVRRTYNRIAWIYDFWALLTESKAQARALELATVHDHQTVLEIAVGTGRTFAQIVSRNPNGQNFGLDLSEAMLNKARRRLAKLNKANYRLEQGNAFTMPYPVDYFDLLINQYMFDLIPDAEMSDLMVEFNRVLREGGKLVLVNMTEPESIWGRIYKLIYKVSPSAMGGCRPVQLSQRLREHGFEVEKREYIQQMLFPSEVLVAYKQDCG